MLRPRLEARPPSLAWGGRLHPPEALRPPSLEEETEPGATATQAETAQWLHRRSSAACLPAACPS